MDTSISNWTIPQLARFIKTTLTQTNTNTYTNLSVDNLVVHDSIEIDVGDIQFSRLSYRYVGRVGQPAFAGAWTNLGSTYANTSFVRRPDGWVTLHGRPSNATNPLGLSSTIFTLPPGFKPEADVVFAIVSNGAFGQVTVTSAGAVNYVAGATVAPAISLDGISYKAA